VLITGASGLLGANLAVDFARQGIRVVAVSGVHSFCFPPVRPIQADLVSDREVSRVFAEAGPVEWVVHCAAATGVDWCEAHPGEAILLNANMAGNVARESIRAGARMIYISTDSVFKGDRGAYSEEDRPAPINSYGRSKWMGEQAVLSASDSHLVVRTNIHGWNAQEKQSLAEWILGRLEAGQDVPGFTDVMFCPVLVNDLGGILLALMEKKAAGILHVGCKDACSKYDFAVKLADVFGLSKSYVRTSRLDEAKLVAPRPRNTSLRTDKATALLGSQAPDVAAGLRRFRGLRDEGFVQVLKATVQGGDHASHQNR
jgi:dTDP-4-dehydrorhamnose reductase